MSVNAKAVSSAMSALGAAYRGDWSNFDGRTLRDDLDLLAARLESDEPTSYEALCQQIGVCHENRCWPEYCTDSPGYSCPHVES